jgi:hypothetical protein
LPRHRRRSVRRHGLRSGSYHFDDLPQNRLTKPLRCQAPGPFHSSVILSDFSQRQLLECSGVLRCQRAALLYERGLSLFRFSFEGCFDDLFADESPRRSLTEQPSAGDPHAVDVSASWANEWRHGNQETHPTNRSNGNSLDGDWTRPLPAFSINGVSEI